MGLWIFDFLLVVGVWCCYYFGGVERTCCKGLLVCGWVVFGVTLPNALCVVVGTQRNKQETRMLMDKTAEAVVLDKLASGNVVARRWSLKLLGKRRRGIFHQVLADPCKAKQLKVTEAEMASINAIPEADKAAVRATWAATDALWEQYKRLVYRLTRNFAVRLGLDESAIPDLEGEATVAFLKSVRGYDDRNFSFSAYFGMGVKTELRRYVKRCRGLAGANEKLLISYQQAWQELANKGLPHAFEDVCVHLNLSKKKCVALWGTLQEPTSEGDMAEPLAKIVVDKSAGAVDADLICAIGMVELSILERDAWITRDEVRGLFPGARKSMKAVAVAHKVSPQAAAYAAQRANAKIVAKLRTVGYTG